MLKFKVFSVEFVVKTSKQNRPIHFKSDWKNIEREKYIRIKTEKLYESNSQIKIKYISAVQFVLIVYIFTL